MIQRVQSLYLLAAAFLLLAFLPLSGEWRFAAQQLMPWLVPVAMVLTGLTAAVALVAIFLYKNRHRQLKVVILGQWLDLALVLVLVGALVGANLDAQFMGAQDAMRMALISVILPFGAYVCLRLARRGIEKDAALVRSMDRLR